MLGLDLIVRLYILKNWIKSQKVCETRPDIVTSAINIRNNQNDFRSGFV